MKKLLCIIAAMTMVGALHTVAEETSREPGDLGFGYQGIFYGNNQRVDAASIRWNLSPMAIQGIIGQMNTDTGTEQDTLVLAIKALYNVIERENSTFYVGGKGGLAWTEIKAPNGTMLQDTQQVLLGVVSGTEYFFQGLPEIGFNFEVGYDFAFGDDDATDGNAHAFGLNVTLGANYYF